LTFLDTEETGLTPTCIPGVGSDPESGGTFKTPTDDFDGVTTEETTGGVFVDAGLVAHEVLVDLETGFEGSIGLDVSLGISCGSERTSVLRFVFGPSLGVLAGASAGFDGTGGGGVWPAGFSNQTFGDDEVPGLIEVATLAGEVVLVAGDHILCGEFEVDLFT